ncbi:MAG TPA: PD-(D/E)XK nuclease family protein [Trichocoleus sp.]
MKLAHYQAKRVQVNRRWHYEIAGHRYPGVTTILAATKPQADREALYRWRQRVGIETAKQISGQASSVGTGLHKHIAAYLKGKTAELPERLSGYWSSIETVLQDIDEVLLVEGAVWHKHGFVGFPDALVVHQGQLCLCDWKTARKPKQIEWITDYCLQVAAYCAAVNAVYGDEGIAVERALIAIALDDQPAQRFEVNPAELGLHWQGFQQRLFQFQNRGREIPAW